ncbi:predicted protein [Naegleria gruberi]|uniref:Predicted protein n=1 Tax=Naegleria gruberi TaxID=5762 RepID=D2VF06_NAEGR|nr:uncharacterized protein NAEGRDRAFT_67460 [Naegleria gruberi]EFC44598.1 predicted protein [Naegleria gruberi]|eukprot:XP_002677342.1 predicted protein [Naegleria gruberi strain NEG-M]
MVFEKSQYYSTLVCSPAPTNKLSFSQFVKDFSRYTWSAICTGFGPFAGTLFGGWFITRQQSEFELNRKMAQEASHLEGQIIKKHTAYSKCMGEIKAFELKVGHLDYAEVFSKKMKESPRDLEITRINECRGLTIDWWEMVQTFHTRYGIEPELKRERYNERFQHFKTLVGPLDRLLEGRNDLLNTIYHFDPSKPRSEPPK